MNSSNQPHLHKFQYAWNQLGRLRETIDVALGRTASYTTLSEVMGTPDKPLFRLALETAAAYSDSPTTANRLLFEWFCDAPDSPRSSDDS